MEFNKLNRKEEYPDRWKVKHDTVNGNWKILDMWHPYFDNIIDLDTTIPDDAPCLKIVSDGELGALLQELDKAGIIQKAFNVKNTTPEIKEIIKEVIVEPKKSESFLLKEKIINSMLALAGMDEMSNIKE